MPEQRKLAVVLAADVVGYSRLMGRDEAGTLARLKEHRAQRLEPALARNGGRLVKLTGDGALAEFPSAVDALRAAIEFQQAVDQANAEQPEEQRVVFRVGLHLGDLIVDGDDLYGDSVNIAARLEGEAAPGGIVVSGALHEAAAGGLQAEFVDLGRLSLKNIDRQVQAYRVEWNQGRQQPPAPGHSTGLAALLRLPDKPSIAVLPFQNMSGDPEQEYFVDGLVEDIITALSRFKSLFVIACNSSFAYKGKSPDIRQVGRELGVRYVLEGSVRKAANRVRITGQLIESETGAHRWADHFDAALEDIFKLQDEVTQKVVTALVPTVQRAEIERARRRPPANLGAYDCYLKGLAAYRPSTKESLDEAMRLFRQALELDPENASAVGMLLACYANRRGFGTAGDANTEKEEVVRLVRLAVHIGGEDAVVLGDAAWAIAYVLRDLTYANEQLERALALNPNAAIAWAYRGWFSLWSGNAAKALEHLSRSMRLDPIGRSTGRQNGLAHAYFFLDRYQEALQWAETQLRDDPYVHPALRIGSASAAFAGKLELAHVLAARLKQADPGFSLAHLQDYLGPYSPEFVEKYKQGLRLAGLPE